MRTQIVKWVSIFGLLSAVLFWSSGATFQPALNLFVCMAAAVVTLQAFQAGNGALVGAFAVIAFSLGRVCGRSIGLIRSSRPCAWVFASASCWSSRRLRPLRCH